MRFKYFKLMLIFLIGVSLFGCSSNANAEVETISNVESEKDTNESSKEVGMQDNTRAIKVNEEDRHYIFDLDNEVNREHIYFDNRFGIEMAADLYTSKNINKNELHTAIVIGPPFGGVKEQGPGVYANELAKRGFVVLAFDPAYHGYSGGSPRYTISTTMYAEDFSSSVDFLSSLDYIDKDKIAVIGICGSGGFALSAAAMDSRIKSVVTSVMYDIAGNMNKISGEQRKGMIAEGSESRTTAFLTKDYGFNKSYPDAPTEEIPENLDETNKEFYSFYGTKLGWHFNALGNFNVASLGDIMTFKSNEHISEIDAPILFIVGENAHSKGYSEEAFANATEPKEFYEVKDANHVDLYYDTNKIPFDKIESFINQSVDKQ